MVIHKQLQTIKAIGLCLFAILVWSIFTPSQAKQNWQSIEPEIANQIFQLNVGLKIKLKNNFWVQVAGTSVKKGYLVFITTKTDNGYQIIGRGTAFPLSVKKTKETYFFTNSHVLDNARQVKEECEMYYAAVAYYAEMNNKSWEDVLNMIDSAGKQETDTLQGKSKNQLVDAIWDCYDNHLSKQNDPRRDRFKKYIKMTAIETSSSYFLHPPGSNKPGSIQAKVYKSSNEPDLAVLVVTKNKPIKQSLKLADRNPFLGEQIEIIGYPAVSNAPRNYYSPTFSIGKITKVMPHMFEFDATISKGDSGGPVVNESGKVLGVVTSKVMNREGIIMQNGGSAIKSKEIKSFVPELFR